MGLFFNDPKPRVTEREWKIVRSKLRYDHYFTEREVNQLEELMQGDMSDSRKRDIGVDTVELVKEVQWLRTHEHIHHISQKKINFFEMEMMKMIDPNHAKYY